MLKIINNSGQECIVKIGEEILNNPELVYLSKYLPDTYKKTLLKISVSLHDQEYLVAGIVYGNYFLKPPVISWENENLTWDGGLSYIGNIPESIELILSDREGNSYGFEPVLGQTVIADNLSRFLPDGQYDWTILINGRELSSGNSFIGNPGKARFINKIVRIDRITEDIEAGSDSFAVKPVYIDNIKYVNTCYVETEDDVYDVYTGTMYWLTFTGKKRYFSFNYDTGKSKYREPENVNPWARMEEK